MSMGPIEGLTGPEEDDAFAEGEGLDMIKALMDPSEEKSEEGEAEEEAEVEETTVDTKEKETEEPEKVEAKVETEKEVEEEPEEEEEETETDDSAVAELKATVAQLEGRLQTLSDQPVAPTAAEIEASKQAAAERDKLPNYALKIPTEITDGLISEDSSIRASAVQTLIAGSLEFAHKALRTEFRREMEELAANIGTSVNSTIQSTNLNQEIHTDFYGEYPQLNVPVFRQIVSSVTGEVSKNFDPEKWTPELRDAIAAKAFKEIETQTGVNLRKKGKSPAPKKGSVRKGKKTPKILKTSAKGKAQSGSSVTEEILALR